MNEKTYSWLLDYAKTIYKNEERREQNIINQATRMQTTFSFVFAALFVIVQILLQYWYSPSKIIIVVATSNVSLFLLSSLVFATIAQWRIKRYDFPSVEDIVEDVKKNESFYAEQEQQDYYLIETYKKLQGSLQKTNNQRNRWLKSSMISFFLSIASCVIWFIVFLCL